jgi:hypothetical protein
MGLQIQYYLVCGAKAEPVELGTEEKERLKSCPPDYGKPALLRPALPATTRRHQADPRSKNQRQSARLGHIGRLPIVDVQHEPGVVDVGLRGTSR